MYLLYICTTCGQGTSSRVPSLFLGFANTCSSGLGAGLIVLNKWIGFLSCQVRPQDDPSLGTSAAFMLVCPLSLELSHEVIPLNVPSQFHKQRFVFPINLPWERDWWKNCHRKSSSFVIEFFTQSGHNFMFKPLSLHAILSLVNIEITHASRHWVRSNASFYPSWWVSLAYIALERFLPL